MVKRKKTDKIIVLLIICIIIIILDYENVPTLLGLNISNINWNFWNTISVIIIFIVTYILLNTREIEIQEREIIREKNKQDISLLILINCYEECKKYINMISDEIVNKYIIPKIDFNAKKSIIITNIQNAPFDNDNVVIDLGKDGQLSKEQVSNYFVIKDKFKQYINFRIIFYDCPNEYNYLKEELLGLLNTEISRLSN